MKNKKKIF